jgi:hypothetical protein
MCNATCFRGIAAAVCLAAMAAGGDRAWAQAPKAVKDQGEFNLYGEVIRNIGAGNFAAAIAGLDAWKQKYPESDYRDERAAFYTQAHASLGQPEKALGAAGDLLGGDLDAMFPGPEGQATVIRVLYNATWAISNLPAPNARELAVGERAARRLLAYDRQLAGVTAEQWAQARADMREKAAAALLHIAMLPGRQAMAQQPPDCAAAELAYTKALKEYPGKAVLSYELGRALTCGASKDAGKSTLAIYEFLRAAVTDATLGNPASDGKAIRDFADRTYIRYHGSDEGLAQLKQLVKQSPLPPEGFQIRSAAEVAGDRDAEFEKRHPQTALWTRIKAALADSNGEQYFDGQLKNAAVPPLKGTLLEAKPACRPTELVVAIPLPDAQPPYAAEILLKLDKALGGRPQTDADLQWEGVPSAFSKTPFLLTMETETAKIQGLKTVPCQASPAKKSPASSR